MKPASSTGKHPVSSQPGTQPSQPSPAPGRSASQSLASLPSPSAPHAASTPKTVVVPAVPTNSWYAQPFTEPTLQPMSEYHANHKGRVVFATRAIPVRQAELDVLPNRSPQTAQFFDLGKDLLYGMAYLHNTALYTEHRWRGRVSHLQAVKDGSAETPETIRKAREAQREAAEREKDKSGKSGKSSKKDSATSSQSPVLAPVPTANTNARTTTGIMDMSRAEPTMYQRPFFDMVVGLKVFVNDELVADHYPGVKSLPQCTTTIDTTDAVNSWNCVPFVLMGYQNHATLDTIDLYRTLSLSFVEHLLHMKFPQVGNVGDKEKLDEARDATKKGGREKLKGPLPAVAPGTRVMEMRLRVEVVYGCRAEAFFCTDFIARGQCTLFMAETAKPALKSYEERLRALVMARRSSEQIIRAPREKHGPATSPSRSSGCGSVGGAVAPVRTCQLCGNLLLFQCTVCGADFCGSLMCSRRELPGYPCGCSAHKAMLT